MLFLLENNKHEKNMATQVSTKQKSRRDFLMLASTAIGTVGAVSFIWPFVDSYNPAADVLAGATIDVDLKSIQPGQAITVMWRGKPLFIRRRTAAEISEMQKLAWKGLPDPEADKQRVKKPEWLVVVGVCTHLGCVPLGQKPTDNRGAFNGWFCPCHGSAYDVSGRVRQGPAPKNLEVPPYVFVKEDLIRVGQEKV